VNDGSTSADSISAPASLDGVRRNQLGMFATIPHPALVELAGLLGFSFVIIDDEQVPADANSAYAMSLAAQKHGMRAYVRLGTATPDRIVRFLGLGCDGILLPGLRTASEVEAIAVHAKYPPDGKRSLGGNFGNRFGFEPWERAMPVLNKRIQVHVIVETKELVEQINAVARLDVVDGIDIGLLDLSVALGYPGNPSAPPVQLAIDRIIEGARAVGKPVAASAGSVEAAERLFERGVSVAILDAAALIAQSVALYSEVAPNRGRQ
jgi:2-keto-3-deoxy-L-rhamnonate aldolase RhmA